MIAIQVRVFLVLSSAVMAICFSQRVLADACDGFVDVDSTASYCAALTFIKSRNITVGCSDTTHFCPSDYVTRAQMALYLQRAAQVSSSNVLEDYSDGIGAGIDNTAMGGGSFVGGGRANYASGIESGIASGYNSAATGGASFVGGGVQNVASGDESTVPGGLGNTASGELSFAAGRGANADQDRCTVFSLWTGTNAGLTCLGSQNVFKVGADHGFSVDYFSQRSDTGGTRWVEIGDVLSGQTIGTWTGAFLSDGGTWVNASDRAAKENFKDIDPTDVLARVAAMPITRWQYKRDPAVTHLGPVAQDFRAAFGLGLNDTSISTVDEEGVALAAIKGLNTKLEATIEQQAAELAGFKSMLANMQAQVAALTKERPWTTSP